jgi:hypothetical protein
MRCSKYSFIATMSILFFLSLCTFFHLTAFSELNDGFYSQIISTTQVLNGTINPYPLFYLHAERLFVFFPFYAAMGSSLEPLIDGLAFILYALPILFFKLNNKRSYSQLLFLFFPFFLSYRATLGICCMCYLFILVCKKEKNYYLLILSLLLSNLSSGIVLSWLFCVILNYKVILSKHKKITPIFVILFVGFISSLINKFNYFFSSMNIKSMGGLLSRSTIYVSYNQNQYTRFIFYTLMIILLGIILSLIISRRTTFSKNVLGFFISALPTLFFEGLGLISYSFCFLWFFVYVQPIVFRTHNRPVVYT